VIAARIFSKGAGRKCVAKLTFKLFKNIFMAHPRVLGLYCNVDGAMFRNN
jgi:hypothetical protein